ncbi:uncharacterized protein PFL1_06374 [Pseudozyma flocculosa PF-1]|uniref:Uncharacterized protein n=2 Tax=Pseudozyma flocculosa TaxID=84751 RepID=A0A5C3F8M1_9BASI|nr:uncharacterized protein PFL1_06374 [Pseudozyma flocculosa PF-1]EPQ26166.1 hypothetical protein PFL1_06374 [Pseudozyma flocculosa PF-1]SPO40416.1 uncharacterized protein PSFLO_05898 [Pseudozyma flocculosa]
MKYLYLLAAAFLPLSHALTYPRLDWNLGGILGHWTVRFDGVHAHLCTNGLVWNIVDNNTGKNQAVKCTGLPNAVCSWIDEERCNVNIEPDCDFNTIPRRACEVFVMDWPVYKFHFVPLLRQTGKSLSIQSPHDHKFYNHPMGPWIPEYSS